MLTVNSGGVLHEVEELHTNSGGTFREIDELYANDAGVLREVFTAWKEPDMVVWDESTAANSYSTEKAHGVETTGRFTIKTKTAVKLSGTWSLRDVSFVGSGSVALAEYSATLNSDDNFSYEGTLPPGDYTITINGGGGKEQSTCGYYVTCSITFSRP